MANLRRRRLLHRPRKNTVTIARPEPVEGLDTAVDNADTDAASPAQEVTTLQREPDYHAAIQRLRQQAGSSTPEPPLPFQPRRTRFIAVRRALAVILFAFGLIPLLLGVFGVCGSLLAAGLDAPANIARDGLVASALFLVGAAGFLAGGFKLWH